MLDKASGGAVDGYNTLLDGQVATHEASMNRVQMD